MKNIIDLLLDSMNRYPVAAFVFLLSLLFFIYTYRFSDLINTDEEIYIVEEYNSWYLAAMTCHKETEIRGSSMDCEEIIISDEFDSENAAEIGRKKMIQEFNQKLVRLDFLNFRYLGSFFINFPSYFFLALGIYDVYRINNKKKDKNY